MKVVENGKGGFFVYCHGQLVLNIDEVSDSDCINLFLTPTSGSIVETDLELFGDDKPSWTHELLTDRCKESRLLFDKNPPLYRLG